MPSRVEGRAPFSSPQTWPTIALLHATYHRPGGVGPVRESWLELADRADLVDYIVAMDCDDPAVAETTGWRRVIGPADGTVSAVRNWNAAAAVSSADLLVVLADDLFPEQGWDTCLWQVIGGWDPRSIAYAVKITDSPSPSDTLLRHPVVSRRFYDSFGLFAPQMRGVYCDDEITRRAYWQALILDGRSMAFEHAHPTLTGGFETDSQRMINRASEYEYGARAYEDLWPKWRRRVRIRIVPAYNWLVGRERLARLVALTRATADVGLWGVKAATWHVRRIVGSFPAKAPEPPASERSS